MDIFQYLCFLLVCYAVSQDMGAQGYQSNPSTRAETQCSQITRDDIEAAFAEAKQRIQSAKAKEKELYEAGKFMKRKNVKSSTTVFHNVKSTLQETCPMGEKQAAFDKASDILIKKYKLDRNQVADCLPKVPLNSPNAAAARENCTSGQVIQCDPNAKYRTIDGTCNNLANPTWGSAFSCFCRYQPAVYVGGSGFRMSVNGGPLPEPRTLSVNIHRNMERPTNYVNHMYMFYGQLLDHDISFTPISTTVNNELLDCCNQSRTDTANYSQCAPINVPRTDYFYSGFGITCLNFVRSQICPYCTLGTRNQINQISAIMDASFVYDVLPTRTTSLRTNDGTGKLRSQSTPVGELPPNSADPGNDQCSNTTLNQICFELGDARGNQHPALTSLHTVFLRLHNYFADQFRRCNPRWNDERIFQEARRIVAAIVQYITYSEYLPITIGSDRMTYFKLWISNGYTTYDPTVNPGLCTEFSTAAFRFGHSMIRNYVAESYPRANHNGHNLSDVFFRPFGLREGEVDMTLRGGTVSPSQWFDRYMDPVVTNFLYRVGTSGPGSDLASLNIQRGRDHGLAPYTTYVEFCSQGQIRVTSFNDLLYYKLMESDTVRNLSVNYASVYDIDLFTGILCEIYNEGAVIGPTGICIIGIQFNKLKYGDRFYFEHGGQAGSFTPAQRDEIKKMTLSAVICHTTNITDMPKKAMLYSSSTNPMVPCPNMPRIDFSYWKE